MKAEQITVFVDTSTDKSNNIKEPTVDSDDFYISIEEILNQEFEEMIGMSYFEFLRSQDDMI